MEKTSFNQLSEAEKQLVLLAELARELAYNPYSHFYVGAAVLSRKGDTARGANVENASYGLTICAERSAIFNANARGIRDLEAIAIITRGESFDVAEPTMPCGACRQVIYEFSQVSDIDIMVISANTKKDKVIRAPISEILLGAFGPRDLGIDVAKYNR